MAAEKLTFEKIIKDIENRVFYPIYYLHGEESFFIDEISDKIADSVLNESEKDFDQMVLYGRDTDIAGIVANAKRYPMMASYQVLIVKEAQNLKDIESLLPYAQNPQKTSILVFCHKYGKLDGRKKLGQFLKNDSNSVFFESAKKYDNQIPDWISERVSKKGYRINPESSFLISEHLGNDLSKIDNELKKLFISLNPGEVISQELIEKNIGISKDFNVFELQKALGEKNIIKCNRIINYFASDLKNYPIQMVIPILFNYFTNLMTIHALTDKSPRNVASALSINPFFVNDYMSAFKNYSYNKLFQIVGYLREYDLKSKGVDNLSTEDGELMKELIFKILH